MTDLRHSFVVRSIEAALAAAKPREGLLLAYLRNYRYLASTNAFTPNCLEVLETGRRLLLVVAGFLPLAVSRYFVSMCG